MGPAAVFKQRADGLPTQANKEGDVLSLDMGREKVAPLTPHSGHRLPHQALPGAGRAKIFLDGQPPSDPVAVVLHREDPHRADDISLVLRD